MYVNLRLICAEKTNTVLETMAFLTYYGSRGATFWVISKNTEVTLTKFCIGHQMRGLFIIFWNDPKSCNPTGTLIRSKIYFISADLWEENVVVWIFQWNKKFVLMFKVTDANVKFNESKYVLMLSMASTSTSCINWN